MHFSQLFDFLCLCRPRTWVFAASSFFFAYSLTGNLILSKAVLGILIAFATTGATNLINAYTDMAEDRVNQPVRIRMLENVGLGNVRTALIIMYMLVLFAAIFMGLPFFLVFLIAVFDSIFYSLPPLEFKRKLHTAMPSFTGAVALAFIGGWVISGNIYELPPVFYIVSFFFFCYFVLKNIPDHIGDKQAKVSHFMTLFKNFNQGLYASFVLFVSPLVLLGILIAAGYLQPRYLLMFALIPPYIALYHANVKAKDTAKLERLHTFGFLYGATFMLLIYFISLPTLGSLAGVAFFYLFLLVVMKLKVDSRQEVLITKSLMPELIVR